jgi:hypothetical protein
MSKTLFGRIAYNPQRHEAGLTVRMSEGKRFCPKCKAWTMEPADEPVPLVFKGKMTPYKCSVCSHVLYEPVV